MVLYNSVKEEDCDVYRKFFKPLLDFILSLILILLLWPLMFVIAIITYVDLGSPIYNTIRKREGKNKKTYIMYKFRTKKLGTEYNPQYTKVSRVIDKLRLNELPQLFNVLKGEMSLVGPRPFIPGEVLPDGKVSQKRYMIRPGITGLAQVSGGRNITHEEKLKYDEIYYDNMSFWLDFKIICKTLLELLEVNVDNERNEL